MEHRAADDASTFTAAGSRTLRSLARKHPIARFVAHRVAAALVLLVLISVLVFAATNVLPGDAATAILGRDATPESLATIRKELGLDRPLAARYASWVGDLARGDLGESATLRQPVSTVIRDWVRNTAILAVVTLALMIPLALVLGIWSGTRAGTASDHVASGFLLGLIAMPEFVVGALLILVFAVTLQLVPAVSLVTPGESPLATPSILVLPVATLLLVGLAYATRMLRAGVAEAMRSEYVEMARLNGLSRWRVIRGALRNALGPSIQVFALAAIWLVGGVVTVEVVFGYPGIGQGLVGAVKSRDLPLVQAIAMLIATVCITINLIADLLVILVIPKIRTAL